MAQSLSPFLADLTVAIALMNAVNRFGVSMRIPPAALAM